MRFRTASETVFYLLMGRNVYRFDEYFTRWMDEAVIMISTVRTNSKYPFETREMIQCVFNDHSFISYS